jgi:hypothetical protein
VISVNEDVSVVVAVLMLDSVVVVDRVSSVVVVVAEISV